MSKTPPEKQELPLETSGGSTDAPTLSGSAPPSAIDSANQQAKK
ncbi:unnamed protein product [Brassica oleracea var. botrytis]|uniref:Uncharacterized protein n=1 Tax=Brassica oleracea TaxID=3712 RepID=A0A3P6CWM4_BRAOL|nr:unnamed protein product [Brassica oleracea]